MGSFSKELDEGAEVFGFDHADGVGARRDCCGNDTVDGCDLVAVDAVLVLGHVRGYFVPTFEIKLFGDELEPLLLFVLNIGPEQL